MTHLPQKYDCLRHVPGYKDFTLERFKRRLGSEPFFNTSAVRCLDLYLVPRALKQRMNVDPETRTCTTCLCDMQLKVRCSDSKNSRELLVMRLLFW